MDEKIAPVSIDIGDVTRKVRDEVLGRERCTLISHTHQFPAVFRNSTNIDPRFELFHFAFSLCSQKVRGTLAEKAIIYGSNEVNIQPPKNENYSPQYVRLRLLSEAASKIDRVKSFTGQSSVESEGFDPLVVPTLVDHAKGRVIADSKAICLYICHNETSGTDLIPDDIKEQVLAQVAIVDSTPHVALLYGVDPDGDRRPASMQAAMFGIHKHKIEAVERNMRLAGDDPPLLTAYRQKITKEEAASHFVVDADRMRSAIARTKQIIAKLDDDLQRSGGNGLFGDRFTLADLFWAVSLYRFVSVGYAGLWTTDRHLPHVEAYADRLFHRQSVKRSIIDWPDPMRVSADSESEDRTA